MFKVLYKKIKLWWLKEKIIKSWLEGESEVLELCESFLSVDKCEIVSLIYSCALFEKDDFKTASEVIETCCFEDDDFLCDYAKNFKKLLQILNV